MLAVKYFRHGQTYPAVFTLMLVILPSIIMQVFSLRWHIVDGTASRWHWVSHIFLLGIIHRYILALKAGSKARSSGDPRDFQRLFEQLSDISLLHLFEAFMESAPQLILQVSVMMILETWSIMKCASAISSVLSLAWAVADFTKSVSRARPEKINVSWPELVCQAAWCGGMISARIAALVLFVVGFRVFIFVLYGVHMMVMMPLICFVTADISKTVWERILYVCVVGTMYFYSFFNLQEGQFCQRALSFCVVIVTQNLVCLGLFLTSVGISTSPFVEVAVAVIIGGQVLGLCSMLLYYCFFHSTDPITLSEGQNNVEFGNGPHRLDLNTEQNTTLQSLKHLWRTNKYSHHTRPDAASPQEQPLHSDGAISD